MKTDWQELFDRMERIDEGGMTMEFLKYQYPYFFAETPDIISYPPMCMDRLNLEPSHKPLHQIMEEGSRAVDKMYADMVADIFNGNFYKLELSKNEASEAAIRLALKGKQFKSVLIDETTPPLAPNFNRLSNIAWDFGLNRIRHETPIFVKPEKSLHNGELNFQCRIDAPSLETLKSLIGEGRVETAPLFKDNLFVSNEDINNFKTTNMKQKFLKNQMISITSPRGVTVAILAEDLNYEKPCMVATEVQLLYDGTLAVGVDLYLHQDVTEVRLADEKEGLRLFKAMKGAGVKKVEEKKTVLFVVENGAIGEDSNGFVCIFNGRKTINFDSFHAYIDNNGFVELKVTTGISGYKFKHVTASGMDRLITALDKNGLMWNPTLKRIEAKLWRAEKGGAYWYSSCAPETGNGSFFPEMEHDTYSKFDDAQYLCGDYSKTPEECQAVCNELNAVLTKVKESKLAIK